MNTTPQVQGPCAIHHNAFINFETLAHLHTTIQISNTQDEWREAQIAIDDLPYAHLAMNALNGCIRNDRSWRQRWQGHGYLGKLADCRQRLRELVEPNLGKRFLSHCIGHRFQPYDSTRLCS